MQVDIGWKSFVIREANSQDGCLDGWEGVNDIGTPFGDGVYEKTTTTYGNGATGAADASVGLFVVSAFVALVMYKTISMSYYGPGSIYSIGLHNVALACLLLSIASLISILAFWGRIQGKLGSLEDSLAATLFKATIDVCEEDWDEFGEEDFCGEGPFYFDVPLYAGILAIVHIAVMFCTSVWILRLSAHVEGILDGSRLADGKTLPPRVVEFENAVGRALATTEDPDYDVTNNKLFTREQKIQIRPYPLPKTVKSAENAVRKASEAIASPLRALTQGSPTKMKKGNKTRRASPEDSPQSSVSNPMRAESAMEVLDFASEDGGSLPPVPSLMEATPLSKAEEKAAKKLAKKNQKGRKGKKSLKQVNVAQDTGGAQEPTKWRGISTLLGGRGARRQFIPSADPLPRMRSTGESDDHSFEVARAASAGNAARATTTGDPTLKHEKSLIQMDWSFIMASAAADSSGRAAVAAAGGGADGGNKGAEAGSPQSVEDLISQLPSSRGDALGAIQEDPFEDAVSEFTTKSSLHAMRRVSKDRFDV